MALTIVNKQQSVFGNMRIGVYTINFDASYPIGGEALTAGALGMNEILFMDIHPNNLASAEYLYGYVYSTGSTGLLTIHYPTGGAAPATVGDPAFVVASGATTMTGSAATLAAITEGAGRGEELLDTTDASTLTIRVLAVGN